MCDCGRPDLSEFVTVNNMEATTVTTADTTPTALNLKPELRLPQSVVLPRSLVSDLHRAGTVVPRELRITRHDMAVPAAVKTYLQDDTRYASWFAPEPAEEESGTGDTSEASVESQASDYNKWSVEELRAEVEARSIEIESGSGSGGNVVKDDLVAALEADDAGSAAD